MIRSGIGRGARTFRRVGIAAAAPLLLAGPLRAQKAPAASGRSEIFVNSDLERYLRYLQTLGVVPTYPWSIRGFSPMEVDTLAQQSESHPWAAHFELDDRRAAGDVRADVVRPSIAVRFNSAFPFGSNDGPIWAGRGLTTSLQLGAMSRWRWLSIKVAPLLFRAENRPFALMPNGQAGTRVFADGLHPRQVDRPQRFGSAPYSMLDPGESAVRFDTKLLTVGLSTADQAWGPADVFPYILGNNAAGYPHAFLGTGMPVNLWLLKVHARLEYGQLAQSSYSAMRPDSAGARRLMSGLIAVVTPRGVPGLELGAARFFHSAWPEAGFRWSDFRIPIEPISKKSFVLATGDTNDVANQLASVFFRWVLPHSGFEVYGELGKEDHNWDVRDLILDPDHAATHMLGFRKAWRSDGDNMIALRGEYIDLRFNASTRRRPLGSGYYDHSQFRQGHTERGQFLGADIPGGSGSGATLAIERYTRRGRWTLEWKRTATDTLGDYVLTGRIPVKTPDVQHALGADALVFRGPIDLHAGVTAVYDINRYFAADRFNINAVIGSQWNW